MQWTVGLYTAFESEYAELPAEVKEELVAVMQALEVLGPALGRPSVDTLNGSKHANMKEIRFKADDGVWRFAFAFDIKRNAVVFCGGDKSGVSEKRFYERLIDKADARFDEHLAALAVSEARKKGKRR
jgi:hypothetical protein